MTIATRLERLETLYAALVRHQSDLHNWRWIEVLAAMKAIGETDEQNT